MKILIACEESQAVCKAFRAKGHEAYSCDILPCSGGHPEWHIQDDITKYLGLGKHDTYYGWIKPLQHIKWDMIIAFPPCTHLAVSGSRHFAKKIADGRQQEGIDFFMLFANSDCPKICIENPVGIMSSKFRKPDQIIQPYEYGHAESKKTCLWLKGLPRLKPTKIISLPESGYWENQTKDHQNKIIVDGKWIGYNDPRTQALRSKTYQGIADAMAEQWGNLNN